MTDSINFIEHTEEGTLVELKGNIHYVDGKACMRIADFKQVLRIYNGMYKGKRKQWNEKKDIKKLDEPTYLEEALECAA